MFKFRLPSAMGERMAASGFIILNVVRGFNILSLLLVAVASWIMLVRSIQTSNFFFFDGVSHVITSAFAIFLLISEHDLLKSWYERQSPLLSDSSGFTFLGCSMLLLGCNILGNLNKPATSVKNLGYELWCTVISAGIVSMALGSLNIVASFCFSNRKAGITARQVRSHRAVGAQHDVYPASSDTESLRDDESQKLPSYHRNSPVAPDIQRPPTAMHPMYSPSRYSVASRVDQF
ncbi:MAG: hypothetical protein M1818_006781 [Claussenomyces sp. TS43310]|nr:MAG: hypothetical protein M1818_006781 [Claussenomyces sp. TS43310]